MATGNNQRQPAGRRDSREDEIDLGGLFSLFASKWIFCLLGLLIGAAAAIAVTYFGMKPRYTATSKLYMVSNSSDTIVDLSDFNIGNSLSSDYEELLKVRPVLEEIIDEEGLPYTYDQLRGMISITTINDTRILNISVSSTSPKESAAIANALADKAVEEIPVMMDTAKPNIAERAIVPDHKSSPSMKKNTAIGGLLGLLSVLAFLTVTFVTNDTITTADDLKNKLGVMPLTVIPEVSIPGGKAENRSERGKRHRHRHRHRHGSAGGRNGGGKV